jgi:hypothetical protein
MFLENRKIAIPTGVSNIYANASVIYCPTLSRLQFSHVRMADLSHFANRQQQAETALSLN